uniref:Uncharacterized protein n=1 Tax=Arundo donax TaxID=35708 RepID=A0A0A9EKE5_ARUDO
MRRYSAIIILPSPDYVSTENCCSLLYSNN